MMEIVIPFYKKCNSQLCKQLYSSYRGITLGTRISNDTESQTMAKIGKDLRGRGVQGNIFVLRAISKTTLKTSREIYLCFVKMEKDFRHYQKAGYLEEVR